MSLSAKSAKIVACGRAAAAGGFVATTIALGVLTVGAPAASVYLWTLGEGTDLIQAVPLANCALQNAHVIIAQASDTTFNCTTSIGANGVDALTDEIHQAAILRASIG